MSHALLVALALAGPGTAQQQPAPQPRIVVELRIFNGATEVTSSTRVTLHRAGERTAPVAQIGPREGRIEIDVPAGIYDAQAILEREGRVISIRWAERLVVMPYPDEAGRHLEVVNFQNGFGALQLRWKESDAPAEAVVYAAGMRDTEAGVRLAGPGYALFVLPAGRYDVQTRTGDRPAWHTGIEVPLNRTRLWIVP